MALGKGLGSLIPQKKTGFGSFPEVSSVRVEHSVSQKEEGRILHIPLSEITPNPDQPRKHFSHAELEDLIESVKTHGVLQPILVSEKLEGGFELIAGERRFRATQMAGFATIPALVKKATNQERLEIALIENIQRQNLNPIEEGFAFKRLVTEFGLTQEEVGRRVGKSRPAVTNTIRLLDLPEVIQRALMDGTLYMSKARAILSLKDEAEQIKMFEMCMRENATANMIEQTVARRSIEGRKGFARKDPHFFELERALEEKFGTKVQIVSRGEKGTLSIQFYSKEELKKITEELLS